mmetsp:Transcript_117076/g.342935  ORF Transcript_117076/g.342935 Transcript_117076/m.342935 type:complete len:325 (-) Transcript_117076:35-1009(-)
MPIYSIQGPIANEVVISEADEGDVVRRLRIKNRKLEQELARLISKREDFYAERVSQADEKWWRLVREKEDADKAWREKHQRSMDETRAGASIMCALFRSQKQRLQEKIRGDRKESEKQLAAAREKILQMEAEHASTTQALQQKLQGTITDYEDKLARQKADSDDRISHLERQLSTAHDETQRLKEAAAESRVQIQELQVQLQRRLADMERLEGLVAAPRTMIKEIQNKAQLQKETLEREIADYVRFIVATHRAASEAPVRPKTTGAARFVTAARPSTPPASPQVPRPLQLPVSARSQLPSALPPLSDEGHGGGIGTRLPRPRAA